MPVEIFAREAFGRKYNRLPLDRPQTAKHAIRARAGFIPALLPSAGEAAGVKGTGPLAGVPERQGQSPESGLPEPIMSAYTDTDIVKH